MKTAHDYAQQAARFALRAGVDAEKLRHACVDERGRGLMARTYAKPASRISRVDTEAYWHAADAARAARAARSTRNGGWWAEERRDMARTSALQAAWCAGYAAGVSLPR